MISDLSCHIAVDLLVLVLPYFNVSFFLFFLIATYSKLIGKLLTSFLFEILLF